MRAQGLVMPPRVAPTQVVVIPIPAQNMPEEARARLGATVASIMAALKAGGVRAQLDDRVNYRPGWKYNHWEVKVPHACQPPSASLARNAGPACCRSGLERKGWHTAF
jgi:prolyl-tRNA synthetase